MLEQLQLIIHKTQAFMLESSGGQLVATCVVLFLGAFLAGLIPLSLRLTDSQLRLLTALGAGLLVGVALAVIIPEGFDAFADAQGDVDDDQQLPHALLGLTLLTGFLSMLLLEQAQSRFTGHNHIMHDGHMDHLSDAEEQLNELSPHTPHSLASKQARQRSDAASKALLGLLIHSGAGWDGRSAALGSCALGEEGDECRKKVLIKDAASQAQYGPSSTSTSGPNMDDAYVQSTAKLMEAIVKYATLDLYSPERVKVIDVLKSDGRAWTSKYARGGSARKNSARSLYIVVDALQGHITSNGLAPFPKNKLTKLLQQTDDAKKLLAQGR
eukprot:jgi/Astpho2/2701/fgenesh1_pg.00050_%23_18_t